MNQNRDRPGKAVMRPAQPNPSFPAQPGATDRLDRVWAATRPLEPTPALLDALWVHASAELDQIEATAPPVIPTSRRWSSRRRVVAGVALAQAAALLVCVGFALLPRRDEPVGPLALNPPDRPASKPMVVVGSEQTLCVRIDADGFRNDFLDQPPMFPTMADNTSHDFFDAVEIAANP